MVNINRHNKPVRNNLSFVSECIGVLFTFGLTNCLSKTKLNTLIGFLGVELSNGRFELSNGRFELSYDIEAHKNFVFFLSFFVFLSSILPVDFLFFKKNLTSE